MTDDWNPQTDELRFAPVADDQPLVLDGVAERDLRILDAAFHEAALIEAESVALPSPDEDEDADVAAIAAFTEALMAAPSALPD
jgi:hypothetical protein